MKKFWIMSFLFCSMMNHSQGKLKSAKDSFKKSESEKYIVTNTESYSSRKDEVIEDFFLGTAFLGGIFLQLTVGLVYYVTVESPLNADTRMSGSKIEPYPFYDGSKGDYTYQPQNPKSWRLEASDSYFNNTDRLQANDLRIKFRFLDRYAVSGTYLHFWEHPIREEKERLDFVMSTFDYYRIRTPHFAMYWGVGVGYIGNEVKESGFAMNVGSELYFKPFSVETSYKFSAISGNNFGLFEIGSKYHFKQYFGQLKYQYYQLGSQDISGFSVGLGFYF